MAHHGWEPINPSLCGGEKNLADTGGRWSLGAQHDRLADPLRASPNAPEHRTAHSEALPVGCLQRRVVKATPRRESMRGVAEVERSLDFGGCGGVGTELVPHGLLNARMAARSASVIITVSPSMASRRSSIWWALSWPMRAWAMTMSEKVMRQG